MLSRIGFGRLACAKDSQPYIVPINFSILANDIVAFSTEGRKIDWMRGNPLVCLEVDEIETPQRWKSVIVLGRYHEVTEAAADEAEKVLIHETLQKRAVWWEPGYAKTVLQGEVRPLNPVYFRISIDTITGHSAGD